MSGIPNRMGGGARRREDCPIYTEKKRKEKAGYVIPVMVMRLSLRADPVVSRPDPVSCPTSCSHVHNNSRRIAPRSASLCCPTAANIVPLIRHCWLNVLTLGRRLHRLPVRTLLTILVPVLVLSLTLAKVRQSVLIVNKLRTKPVIEAIDSLLTSASISPFVYFPF